MDDVLAQPTRARLFALLQELMRPAGTEELAQRLGLHVNGVRTHLARLADAGLVRRERVPQERGRPRDGWTVAARPTAYEDLGRWLVRAIPPTAEELRRVEDAGRAIGAELAPGDGDLYSALGALGFRPAVEEAGGRTCYVLGTCPYRDAVADNQPLVCTLHRGLTRGILDRTAPGSALAAFEPKDPRTAGCRIEVVPPRSASGPAS
jgi:predicted ArsR family transcriptional regulator